LGIRPSALHQCELSQFQKITVNDAIVWRFTEKVGSRDGASKVARGGWKDTNYKPVTIDIWDFPLLDGALNVYEEFESYFELRKEAKITSNRFFLQTTRKKNVSGLSKSQFWVDSPIGKNGFKGIVKNMCLAEGIKGNGVHDYVTTHGLRGSMSSLLLEAGFSDTAVAQRTGHRSLDSLRNYKDPQGETAPNMQRALFNNQDYSHEELGSGTNRKNKRSNTHLSDPKRFESRKKPSVEIQDDDIENSDEMKEGIVFNGANTGTFTFHVHNHYHTK